MVSHLNHWPHYNLAIQDFKACSSSGEPSSYQPVGLVSCANYLSSHKPSFPVLFSADNRVVMKFQADTVYQEFNRMHAL